MSAIEVKDLVKNYGPIRALDGITFNLEKGEVLAFLGPNGAGKTTAMKIITCYLEATSGSVRVNDVDVREDPLKVRKMIGYLPESTPLYEDIIVYDFLNFAGKIHNIPNETLDKRIKVMAEICGITDMISRKIKNLSKGYRQRVGLAYAMLHDPEILILDEPTTGLDPNQIIEIRNLIKELGKKKSVILSTHILSEAEATAQRAIIIDNGRLVADGTVSEIKKENLNNEKSFVIKLKDENLEEELVRNNFMNIPEVNEIKINPNDGFWEIKIKTKVQDGLLEKLYSKCKEQNYIIYEFGEKELSLEEIFIHLTKREVTENVK
jgi:ABC-2 type transport system ATP-binding protein